MSTKYNTYAFKMRQLYGNEWNAPLFKATSSHTQTEELQTPAPPKFINDATEEKAAVYTQVSTRKETDVQRDAVLDAIKRLSDPTDNDIARYLNIVPSTVAARRNELRDMGLVVPVLDQYGHKKKKIDPITKTPNTIWRAVK